METILFNEAMNALSVPDRGIPNFTKSKIAHHTVRHLQAEMVATQRFVLDDNMVKNCVAASFDKPSNLLKFAERAIPPFDSVFIEWDEQTKLRHVREQTEKLVGENKIDPDDSMSSKKCGYLIRRINDRILYSCVWSDPEIGVYFVPYGFYFDQDNPVSFQDTQGTALDNDIKFSSVGEGEENFRGQQITTALILMGRTYWMTRKEIDSGFRAINPDYLNDPHSASGKDGWLDVLEGNKAFNWFRQRILGAETMMGLYLEDEEYVRGYDPAKNSKIVNQSHMSMEGDVRFLICALGFLNYDHIIIENHKPDPEMKKRKYGRIIPQNEYRVVSIDLPTRAKIIRRGILTGQGTPKKRHWCRGHMRRLKSGKSIWIRPHERGNEAYGTIYHDYHLKGKTA